jgi:phage gp36-like protein
MFLSQDELKSAIYEYQVTDITEGDDTIVENAIAAAIDEVKAYLTPNNRLENWDGRVLYDTEKLFAAEGSERNALILAHTKTIAKWWIILLANPDIIYEQVKERYDRSIEFLTKVAKGVVTLAGVPILPPDNNNNAFLSGSRRKFNHEEDGFTNPFGIIAVDTPFFTNKNPV